MNEPTEDKDWQVLSRALFGRRRTTDESLFTYQVMERVRLLQPDVQVVAWHHFLRWAIPMLGAGAACLILASRVPVPTGAVSLDTVLLNGTASNADLLFQSLEDSR